MKNFDKKAIIPPDLRKKYEDWHFSPAVESGGFLFVSGCTGIKLDGTISSDKDEQFRQAFKTAEKSLLEAGLSFSNVVEMTTYHVGLRKHLITFMSVKDEFISKPFPAWTAIGVTELAIEGAIIEIQITAKI